MHVTSHYTLPPLVNTFDPGSITGLTQTINPKASTGSTTSTSSTTSSDGDLGTTFLYLLATELQNQDPTDPVDSTAMVGQMISLNQLDQLISINQALTSPSSSTSANGSARPSSTPSLAAPSSASGTSPAPAAGPNPLPFNPNTMMPVDPALMPAPMNSLTSSTNTSGGK
jgi:flagellar basal-body rod modification protein FlgD